jgi:hypothetical protein
MSAIHTNTPSPARNNPTSQVDDRVSTALAEAGLSHQLFQGGDFILNFNLAPEVTVAVGVTSTTATICSHEYRRVFSVGCSEGDPGWGEHLWGTLLRLNGGCAMGMWEITRVEDYEVALFSLPLPADATAGELHAALLFAAININNLRALLQGRQNQN